jgi:hypothetical protein
MKHKLILLLLLISVYSWLQSVIYYINQDGSADFTSIQEGINSPQVFDGDWLIAYPGIYYENLDLFGKELAIGSLYLTTGNENYVQNTIIDGGQNGSCIRIVSGENDWTFIYGLTIRNGSGSQYNSLDFKYGGGLLIYESSPSIINCIIEDNFAQRAGGGIYLMNSAIIISGTTIRGNHSRAGGGICIVGSTIEFDSENLCNIYLNYAGNGCEILKHSDSPEVDLYVDTFTVMEPDEYFISSTSSTGFPLNDVNLNILNAKLEPVNADLYVALEGDNTNSGLTADDPLATINYALSLVKSDSLHPNTIHIANGLYSRLLNNQCFPLNMRGYVSLVGQSMENTILDAENNSPNFSDSITGMNYSIRDLSILNGNGIHQFAAVFYLTALNFTNRFVNIENVTISGCQSFWENLSFFNMNLNIENIYNFDNQSIMLRYLNTSSTIKNININSALIKNNEQYDPGDIASDAHPQLILGMQGTFQTNITITNMELTNNTQTQSDWPETSAGICLGDSVTLNLINCTIGNNSSPDDGGVLMLLESSQNTYVNIYNSILYGNSPAEISIRNEFSYSPSTINIHNSLVEGGENGIQNPYSWNLINWLENNLLEDPLWIGIGDYPYALQSNSPCIDAGTMDLPNGIVLPEFDLAGNPRIYGSTVDMGAYEWQGTGTEEVTTYFPLSTHLTNYPNPFNPSTTISFSIEQNEQNQQVELSIFNIKGQKVKTLIDAVVSATEVSCTWNGKDENGKRVSSGQYTARLMINGEEKAVRKIMLVK